MKKVTLVALVAALVWPVSACVSRRTDADSVDTQIKDLPGVSSTDLDYKASLESGQVFRLTVMLDRAVTVPQARDVGTTFVGQMNSRGMAGHKVDLNIRYPASRRQQHADLAQYSQARFEFGKSTPPVNPDAKQVSDSLAVWLHAVRTPVSQSVFLNQPVWGEPADSRNIAITLKPDATAAEARTLQHSDPALAEATWQLSIVVSEADRPRIYAATPDPPSDDVKALWHQISDVVDQNYDVSGVTRPPKDDDQAKTKIEVDIGSAPGHEEDLQRIARAVAALLPRFDHPAALVVWGPASSIEIVVGGCYRHKDDHERLPLELELSEQYERC